jgi:hypothetical protein
MRNAKSVPRLVAIPGEVRLKIPKLRRQTFETAIIERYRRRESSVEEALIALADAWNLRKPSMIEQTGERRPGSGFRIIT